LAYLRAYAMSDERIRARYEIVVEEFSCRRDGEVERVADVLKGGDIIGFSCYIGNMPGVDAVGRLVRDRNATAKIVLGGPNVDYDAAAVLRETPWADVVVRGEGEVTFAELLRRWGDDEDESSVAGLAYRKGNRIIESPARPPIGTLDDIPSPYLDGGIDLKKARSVSNFIQTSRGCPFSCAFCQRPGNGQRPRYFSGDRVMAEMEHVLRERGKGFITVIDSDPFMNGEYFKSILDRFATLAPDKNVVLALTGNLFHLKEEMTAWMDSPRIRLAFGIQNINPEVLRVISRRFDKAQAETKLSRLLPKLTRADISLQIMLGLPKDTYEAFIDMLDWCLSFDVNQIIVYRTWLLPGTELWEKRDEYGLKYEPRLFNQVMETPTFSRGDLDRAQELGLYIDLFRTIPVVRSLLAGWGRALSGRIRNANVVLYQKLKEYLTGERGNMSESLDRRREMDWSRRGLYYGGENTFTLEERVEVLKGLKGYGESLEGEFGLPPGHWRAIIDRQRRRYEWLMELPGYLKKIAEGETGVPAALLVGSDLVRTVEILNGEGWTLRGLDLTEKAHQSILQLAYSRQWDAVRVLDYAALGAALPEENRRTVIFEEMWERLSRDPRSVDKVNGLAVGGSMIFLERDAVYADGGQRFPEILKTLGYRYIASRPVASGVSSFLWEKDK